MTGQVKVSQPKVTGTLTISSGTISGQTSASVSNVVRSDTGDYDKLDHKPSINGHVVEGDKLSADYDIDNNAISNTDILSIIMR